MTIQHQTIKAHDLRPGDLMRLGTSTNYVLVANVHLSNNGVNLTAYDGENPNGAAWTIDPDETVSLSCRDLGPNDTIVSRTLACGHTMAAWVNIPPADLKCPHLCDLAT